MTDTDNLFRYPLPANARLTSHYWFPMEFDRYLTSAFFHHAEPDARGCAHDLWAQAQRQTPVGTLPDDDLQLAHLAGVGADVWREMMTREYGPLYKWKQCLVGEDTIRLWHPVVLEVTLQKWESHGVAMKRKAAADERTRVSRIRTMIPRAGGSSRQQVDRGLMERLDTWLTANWAGRRTVEAVREALEFDANRDVVGIHEYERKR